MRARMRTRGVFRMAAAWLFAPPIVTRHFRRLFASVYQFYARAHAHTWCFPHVITFTRSVASRGGCRARSARMRTRGVLLIFLCLDMIKHTYIDLLVVVSVTLSCARACAHAVFFAPVVWLFLVNRTCCPLRLCSLLGLSERAHAHTWCFSHMASVGRSSFVFAVVCSCIISSCCERARMRIRGVFYTFRVAVSLLFPLDLIVVWRCLLCSCSVRARMRTRGVFRTSRRSVFHHLDLPSSAGVFFLRVVSARACAHVVFS